ncbi:MAG: VanZ family protein [Gemmatimonadales bacterium]
MGLAVAGAVLIALATLTPSPDSAYLASLTPVGCLVCGDEGGADIIANLILFLPFAAGLRLAGVPWRRCVLWCAGTSFTIELLQLVAIPGRDASLSDLITNTASGAIGAALGVGLPVAVWPPPIRARRLLLGGSVAWIAALAFSGWLLQPSIPADRLTSLWAPKVPETGAFGGRVLAVRLDGVPMPDGGEPPDAPRIRGSLESETFTLDVDVVTGRRLSQPAWIYGLLGPSTWAFGLLETKDRAALVLPVRGLRFRSRLVSLTLPGGIPAMPGTPVHLRAVARGGVLRLSSTADGTTREVRFTVSPAYGWRLISPFEIAAGERVRWFSALCLAVSTIPLGYWGARTERPVRAVAWLVIVAVAGLALLPGTMGFAPVDGSEWIAVAVGLLAGWAVHGAAAYLERRCALPSASGSSSS